METEEERRIRWKKRIEEMRKKKRRLEILYHYVIPGVLALVVGLGVGVGVSRVIFVRHDQTQEDNPSAPGTSVIGEAGEDTGVFASAEGYEEWVRAAGGAGSIIASGVVDPEKVKSSAKNKDISLGKDTIPAIGTASAGQAVGNRESIDEAEEAEEPEGIPEPTPVPVYEAHSTDVTVGFDDNIISSYGVLIDVEDGTIIAQREGTARMSPASMTKILTVLVAAEHISPEQLEDKFSITIDITDYCYVNGCSITGYGLHEQVTVRDLFYGTILPSGADSALALAIYVAGSHEAFVELMNEKLVELGLGETTHFTNCVGLYDEEHYSTAYDIAMIMKAATDNDFCREVLSARTYNTSMTEQHPNGLSISNLFLRRIEERDTHGEVICAKTGYVSMSGSCAASLSIGNDGREYLCVTARSSTSMQCIEDQTSLYQFFLPE